MSLPEGGTGKDKDWLPAGTIAVLMGVTGSGKTTIGQLLSKRTGVQFADADDYHSAANKAKMTAGTPLTDEDRAPWLETLNELLVGWHRLGAGGILACSALKDYYRTTLQQGMPEDAVHFVLLEVPRRVLEDRLAHRKDSFMNPALLDSQIATLEEPAGGQAIVIQNDRAAEDVVTELIVKLEVVAGG